MKAVHISVLSKMHWCFRSFSLSYCNTVLKRLLWVSIFLLETKYHAIVLYSDLQVWRDRAHRTFYLGVGVAFPKPTLLPSPSGRCDSTSCPVRWDQPRARLPLLYGLRWGFLIPIFMLLLVPVAKFIFSASYIVVLTFDFSNFSCQAK